MDRPALVSWMFEWLNDIERIRATCGELEDYASDRIHQHVKALKRMVRVLDDKAASVD